VLRFHGKLNICPLKEFGDFFCENLIIWDIFKAIILNHVLITIVNLTDGFKIEFIG
jgi:hypothetical protein